MNTKLRNSGRIWHIPLICILLVLYNIHTYMYYMFINLTNAAVCIYNRLTNCQLSDGLLQASGGGAPPLPPPHEYAPAPRTNCSLSYGLLLASGHILDLFIQLSIYLSIHHIMQTSSSIYQSIYLSIKLDLLIHLSIYLSIKLDLFIHLFIYLSSYVSNYLS